VQVGELVQEVYSGEILKVVRIYWNRYEWAIVCQHPDGKTQKVAREYHLVRLKNNIKDHEEVLEKLRALLEIAERKFPLDEGPVND
jgi:hypothetical protein